MLNCNALRAPWSLLAAHRTLMSSWPSELLPPSLTSSIAVFTSGAWDIAANVFSHDVAHRLYVTTIPANEAIFWVFVAVGFSGLIRVILNVFFWHPHVRYRSASVQM